MDYELQFLVMVNCELELDVFLSQLRQSWLDIHWKKRSSFDFHGNWIQISKNEDFDPSRIGGTEDDFLYYKYRIEVSPIKDEVELQEQVALSRLLSKRFESMGCLAIICADFEELLDVD